MKVSMVKRGKNVTARPAMAIKGDVMNEFHFVDNGNGTYAVEGVSAAGNVVDISNVATIAVTSADPSKVAVDPPVSGMTFGLKAVGPVTIDPVEISVVATWNDGSVGPFSFTAPATVVAGPAAGVRVVDLGTPVVS